MVHPGSRYTSRAVHGELVPVFGASAKLAQSYRPHTSEWRLDLRSGQRSGCGANSIMAAVVAGCQDVAEPQFLALERPLPIATDEDDDSNDDCPANRSAGRDDYLVHVRGCLRFCADLTALRKWHSLWCDVAFFQ